MNRRRIATLLATLVALSGTLPIVLLAGIGLEVLRQRGEQSSREALQAIAEQAAARISAYIAQQREMLRAVGMALGSEPDGARRLADVTLDAPSLGKPHFVTGASSPAERPSALTQMQIDRAVAGKEVVSETYIADLSPAMDACVPSGVPNRAVCSTLDLLELQRQVQRIRVGDSGYALAFDHTGRLVAAGAGTLRASVLSGEPVAESAAAIGLARTGNAPQRLLSNSGAEVIAGWAFLPDLGWSIAVEEPVDEALRGARSSLLVLAACGLVAVLLSLVLGASQARRMLAGLELEERFRTAGRIAAGITHDLGHRLAILQQIEQLAATEEAAYLPRIRESLQSEVSTLRRFVSDFADLTRDAKAADFLPVELNALADSVKGAVEPYATERGLTVDLARAQEEVWVRGDRYLLDRALLNLARNAVEASSPGSRVVLRVSSDERSALVAVEDEGAGIEPDRLAGLFDSFTSTKRTGAHVGMGLPNVRRIVSAHGGTVSVKSALRKGSTFTISLPLAPQSSSPSVS